jgi:hypothetical protein
MLCIFNLFYFNLLSHFQNKRIMHTMIKISIFSKYNRSQNINNFKIKNNSYTMIKISSGLSVMQTLYLLSLDFFLTYRSHERVQSTCHESLISPEKSTNRFHQ